MTDLHLPWRYDSTIHAIVDARFDFGAYQVGDKTGVVVKSMELCIDDVDAVVGEVAMAIAEAVNRHGALEEVAKAARDLHPMELMFSSIKIDALREALRDLDGGGK